MSRDEQLQALADLAGCMFAEFGNGEPFDALQWTRWWIDQPLPALGGKAPTELLGTEEGFGQVQRVLRAADGSVYL